MFATSTIGRLASGQASASSLTANPLNASSILEQIASHVYLGPGTPTSAVMSLTAISEAHLAMIPTTKDPRGQIVLTAVSISHRSGLGNGSQSPTTSDREPDTRTTLGGGAQSTKRRARHQTGGPRRPDRRHGITERRRGAGAGGSTLSTIPEPVWPQVVVATPA
jgi:hypothetical protein